MAGQNTGHLAQEREERAQNDRCSLTDPLEEKVIHICSLRVCRTRGHRSREIGHSQMRHSDELGRNVVILFPEFRHKP